MALTDPLAPLDSLNLADWCHVSSTGARIFQPDPQLRVEIPSGSTTADVYYGSKIVRQVFLQHGSCGGLVPISTARPGVVDPFSYAVATLFDEEGLLDRDMEELGLSVPH